eukprot:jgi/Ulvmu1/2105/UM125_0009.1
MDDELVLKPTLKAKSTLKKGPGSDGHDDLVEFVLLAVKAVIHHFLFQRKVYPDRWFKSERVFLTHTQACRHPSVRDYISEAAGSIKDALSAGHVETICVGLQCPGCALHEMLCIHPSILLPQQTDTRPPWEEIDDALRGLLLQLQHLNFAMPPPKEGTVFCISVQMQNKSSLSDQKWALYEDPVQSAIAAAQAQPSAQHSHAAPPAGPALRCSTSGADTAVHGSPQSPYVSAQHPAHGSGSGGQHADAPFADPPPAAPTPAPAALAADASDPAACHPSAAQQHVVECMHDVGFGRDSGMHAAEGGVVWGSQQSQGVQSQTQQRPAQAAGLGGPEQGSNSAQRPGSAVRLAATGSQPQAPGQPQHMHPLSGSSPLDVQRQERNIQAAGRKRPRATGAVLSGGAERHGKAARTGANGADACGVLGRGHVTRMTRIAATAGDSAVAAIAKAVAEDSPLLETLEQNGDSGPGSASPADGREHQSKDDTESYGAAGCPRFQAAQVMAPDPEAAPSPTAVTLSGSSVRAAPLAASPGGTNLVSGHGDTLLQDGSPAAHSVPPRQRGWPAQRGGSRGPSGGGGGGGALASGGILHEALVPQPNVGPSAGEPAASSSLVATEPQGDTLIEEAAPERGRAVELAGDTSGGEEATSPGESPEEAGDAPGTGSAPILAADFCAGGSNRIELGGAAGPGPAAGSGSREIGQSHQTESQEYKAAGGDSDGQPDYFADLMGSGPFLGFGQQPEARVSHSGVSDGQPPGSIGSGEGAQASPSAPESPSAAADASSDHEKGGVDYSCPPAAPVAEMVLRPLVDSCIPGVLEIRANVLHLRQKPHKR